MYNECIYKYFSVRGFKVFALQIVCPISSTNQNLQAIIWFSQMLYKLGGSIRLSVLEQFGFAWDDLVTAVVKFTSNYIIFLNAIQAG